MTPIQLSSTLHTNYIAMEGTESPFIESWIIPFELFKIKGVLSAHYWNTQESAVT
jgi:hypothetical protein